jgi:general secretion pathway protein G
MVICPRHRLQARSGIVGFTLIELMVVLAVVALLLSVAVPRYFNSVNRAKESVLRANLSVTRDALDKYFGDTGRYPDSLEQLVRSRYLRSLPVDPITESATTWIVQPPDRPERSGAVFDLHSGAQGKASDGSNFSDW